MSPSLKFSENKAVFMLLKLLQIFHVSWITFRQITPKGHLENEKRLRREIANSNERRRMQSINAGFQVLRTLIPHGEGEKLSKVCHSKTRIGWNGNLHFSEYSVLS